MENPDNTENNTKSLFFEDSIGNSIWRTNGEYHRSTVIENAERVIKVETDVFDNYTFESIIEITNNFPFGMFSSIYYQEAFDSLITSTFNHLENYTEDQGNSSPNIKMENDVSFNSRSVGVDLATGNNLAVPPNFIMMNSDVNINKKKNVFTAVTESVNSECVNIVNNNEPSVQTVKHDLMVNNSRVNVKKVKNSCTNVIAEVVNSDHIDVPNHNESSVQSVIHSLNVNQEHNDLDIQSVHSLFKISPNIGSSSTFTTNIDREKSFQRKHTFECNICSYTAMDRHSFALHMGFHTACNMHECIVCDMSFITVISWTNHMKYHEQKAHLHLLNTDVTSNGIVSNIPDTKSESMEPVVFTNFGNEKNKISSNIQTPEQDISSLKSARQITRKQKFTCNTCQKKYSTKVSLINHQVVHRKVLSFSCQYCTRKFKSKGPYINHEKSHTYNGFHKL